MRLLFLTPQLPHPPRQGTAIRNWGLIKSLSARHRITLLTFAEPDAALSPELRAACQRIETVPPPRRTMAARLWQLAASPLPDLAHRLASRAFAERLAALMQSKTFDAVFCEGLELAPFLFTAEGAENVEKSKEDSAHSALSAVNLFDAHNCETMLQSRAFESDLRQPRRWPAALYSLIQSRRLARYEAQVCQSAHRVLCVSSEDAAALRSLWPGVDPVIVPNGIFLAEYASNAKLQTSNFKLQTSNSRLVFTGKMDYRPNVDAAVWFTHEIFPAIRREAPEAEFVVVGQSPTQAVRQLATEPGVRVTGAMDDARPFIAGAAVYVAPLRMGGGTRFKLLEAMALRRAIVSTHAGAEGFGVANGRELRLADTPEAFARAVVALLHDEGQRAALGAAGHEFAKRYDWGEIVPRVEEVLNVEVTATAL